MKGGTFSTPFGQAQRNRSILRADIKKLLDKNIYLPFTVIFDSKVTIEKVPGIYGTDAWFTITDNTQFEKCLLQIITSSTSELTKDEVNNYVEQIGINCEALKDTINNARAYYNAGQIKKAYDTVKSLNTAEGYEMCIRCKEALKHDDILDTILKAEKQDVKYAYYCHAKLLENGFRNISQNLTAAKELYIKAIEKGYEYKEAQKGIYRIESIERNKRQEKIRKEEERIQQEKLKAQKESILEYLKGHDFIINLWFCSIKLSTWIAIIGFYFVFFSVISNNVYENIILSIIKALPFLITALFIDSGNDPDVWKKYISCLQYKSLPKLINSEYSDSYNTDTTVHDYTNSKRITYTILTLILLAISLLGIYFILNYITHLNFIHILDFKLLPIHKLLAVLMDGYTWTAIISFLSYCLLNVYVNHSEVGLKPGLKLFRYWIRMSIFLIRPCIFVACMTIIPATCITSFQQWNETRKTETEKVDNATQQKEYIKVHFDNPITFAYGSTKIQPLAAKTLTAFADALKKEAGLNYIIYGCVSNRELQNGLGYLKNKRAEVVKEFLYKKGIDSRRISINNNSPTKQAIVEIYIFADENLKAKIRNE